MADVDSKAIQQDLIAGVAAEVGFDGIEEIGRGGFGVVYRCAQPQLDRSVAVKVLTNDLDPDNLDRFIREQRAMGRLSAHPHIVTVLQVGTTLSGRPFIVMPYHGKGSLWGLVSGPGPLDWRETLSIGVKIAGALEAAHRAGILHRDVKPGNVLLTDYGQPQLTDFGLARVAGGFETRAGVVIGSPAFIAPELLEGATPTTGSDVYSLGATLFCALTGHPPMGRSVPELLGERDVPDDVVAVVELAMTRDPSNRPTTAAEYGGPCPAFRMTAMASPPSQPSWTRPPESACSREATPPMNAKRPVGMPALCSPESIRPLGRWQPFRPACCSSKHSPPRGGRRTRKTTSRWSELCAPNTDCPAARRCRPRLTAGSSGWYIR